MRTFQLPPLARPWAGDAAGHPLYVVCLTSTHSSNPNDVGLLACSCEGRVRYWERVTLTGADEYAEMAASLDLRPGRGGVALINCEVRVRT